MTREMGGFIAVAAWADGTPPANTTEQASTTAKAKCDRRFAVVRMNGFDIYFPGSAGSCDYSAAKSRLSLDFIQAHEQYKWKYRHSGT
ncbi:hypothetical protein HII36_08420 [Nonomuraea sp. NN258]|nr:hypothetical protein [Nonomuraea antri]